MPSDPTDPIAELRALQGPLANGPGAMYELTRRLDRAIDIGVGLSNALQRAAQLLEAGDDSHNLAERSEDAARRFAGELARLHDGLVELGIPMRDGPLTGREVDTALEWIRDHVDALNGLGYLQATRADV